MLAVDVNSKNDLDNFFEEHLRDNNFIGGAVAAPIKQAVTDYFYENQNNNFELPTNCFYRGSNNNFVCLNTDILAAMHSIERNIDINNIESLAILGDGSVGLSLAKHLQSLSSNKTLYTRNPNKIDIKGFNIHDYEQLFNNLSDYDLIINCTSVGKDAVARIAFYLKI